MREEKKRGKGFRALCLFLAFALLVSFRYFFLYSKERDSEYYVNSMISAGLIGKEMPGSLGMAVLKSGDRVFDGEEGGNIEGSALYIAYHPEEFSPETVEIEEIRLQQLGLQGWLAYGLGNAARLLHLSGRIAYYGYRWLNALLLSVTLLGIALELRKAYDELFAAVFFAVCLLSNWIAVYAANLYWMEFTWFLPMLFGLMAMNRPRRRGWYYLLILAAVALKCGCGYEYVTNVMLGPVLFLLAEWLGALKEKNGKAWLLFRTLVGASAASLGGFVLALFLHAYLRVGDIYGGLLDIYYSDVVRRTVGMQAYYGGYGLGKNLEAILGVLAQYWLLSATGLLATGSLLANLVLFFSGGKRKGRFRDVMLLLLAVLASSSWFILAKRHSQIHLHLNGVLFYLPFMQISVYLLVKQLLARALRGKEPRLDSAWAEGLIRRMRDIALGNGACAENDALR